MNTVSNILSTIFMPEPGEDSSSSSSNIYKDFTPSTGIDSQRLVFNARFILNKEFFVHSFVHRDSYDTVKLILSRLARHPNISMYSRNIYVPHSIPRMFQKMFIDDPSMYFTGFVNTADQDPLKKYVQICQDCPTGQIRGVVIVMSNYTEKYNKDKQVLLHKRESCIGLQTMFFDTFLKGLFPGLNKESFFDLYNDENSDIDYVAVSNKTLYYM